MYPSFHNSIRLARLKNGLSVATIHYPHLHHGHIMLFARSGPRYEVESEHGLAHFCEHMLFRGAGSYATPAELSRAFEDAGGHIEATTYRDHTVLSTPYAPGGLGRALDVLAAMAGRPLFRSIGTEMRIVFEEIREFEDARGTEIDPDNLVRAMLFKGHAFGRRTVGTRESVGRFTRRRISAFHRRCFGARNMALVIAGPEDPGAVLRMARLKMSSLDTGSRLPLDAPSALPRRGPRLRVVSQDSSQTELRFCFPAPGESHPASAALALAQVVLSGGGASRLQADLVDRRGLAYELWADLDLSADVGVLEFGALVEHRRAAATVAAMLRCVAALASEGPTDEELRRAKKCVLWGFDASVDSPQALGAWVGWRLLFDLDVDVDRAVRRIRGVRAAEVRSALRAVFDPKLLCLVAAGCLSRREAGVLRRLLRRLPCSAPVAER